ncbi:MAG: 3-isopropylmalate dehydratase small subunit [Cyanobacteriota bacterium]
MKGIKLDDKFQGKVWKYHDNVDTDVIIPARYLNTSDPNELALHCMEDIDKTFAKEVKQGDIIVAEENFGCGSSREHAPISIKASGISVIIAKTFARIFFRNAINIGLPILECPELCDITEKGDIIEVNLETGDITNMSKNKSFKAKPYPEDLRKIIISGGLIEYTKQKVSV